MKMGTLYRLDFPSGKSYVGVTLRAPSERFRSHACAAKDGSRCLVHQAWRKHGAPKLVVLSRLRERILFDAEKRAIAKAGTMVPNGYNMTPGGDISPRTVPEIAQRMWGRKISAKTRAKMSAALKGRFFSPETRAKISAAKKGHTYSAETRRRMSEAHRRGKGEQQ